MGWDLNTYECAALGLFPNPNSSDGFGKGWRKFPLCNGRSSRDLCSSSARGSLSFQVSEEGFPLLSRAWVLKKITPDFFVATFPPLVPVCCEQSPEGFSYGCSPLGNRPTSPPPSTSFTLPFQRGIMDFVDCRNTQVDAFQIVP